MTYRPAAQFKNDVNTDRAVFLDNIRANLGRKHIPRIGMRKAVVCGGGPSLGDHLDEIREKAAQGFNVWALNGSGRFLKENGIQPTAILITDARPENVVFVDPVDPDATYFLASCVHPSLFQSLEYQGHDKVYMLHADAITGAAQLISENEAGATVLGSAPTAGLQVLNVLTILGYKIVHLYGYDSSHRDGAHHAYDQALNDDEPIREFAVGEQVFTATLAMASQVNHFIAIYKRYEAMGIRLEVFGEGYLPTLWRWHEGVEEHAPLGMKLRTKHEKYWTLQSQRKASVGAAMVDMFTHMDGVRVRDSVLDLGCGTGSAANALIVEGFDVTAVDIARNAPDPDCVAPFVACDLSDMPGNLVADWAFCVNVLEQIPEDEGRLERAMANIARAARKGAFFNISSKPDGYEQLMGEQMSLTVCPKEWWIDVLKRHFASVEPGNGGVIYARH